MLLKLAAGVWKPLCNVISTQFNGKNITLLDQESLIGKIFNELTNTFNFSYQIVNQDANIGWGNLNKSVDEIRFNGMVGMIQRNEVDLAVGPLSVDYGHRDLVSNPSTIILETELLLLSSGVNIKADQNHFLSPLLKTFETRVWILSLFAIIFISMIRSVADLFLNSENRIKFMKLLENNLFFHHRSITRQDTEITANQFFCHKIMNISWLLPSFLLSLFYSSMILAQLLAVLERPIDSLNDLANAEDVMITAEKNTQNEIIIKEGQSEDHQRIYSRVKNKFGEENCFVSTSEKTSDFSVSETLAGRRLLFDTIIVIKNILSNQVKQRKSCGFHMGSAIEKRQGFMLFNKRFDEALKRKIDRRLLIIFERRPFDFVINARLFRYSLCLEKNNKANINNENKSLSFTHIHALILVCLIMIVLAHIIFIYENLLFQIDDFL